MAELPMFPLGTVLLPHMLLPLHVFEDRYRRMLRDVLDADGRFGVSLIRRGHEVGGGDVRTDLGTVARVLQAQELDDGRWVLLAVGQERIDVDAWLPDDPYPRARTRPRGERHDADEVDALHARLLPRLRVVLELQQRVGDEGVPPDTDLDAAADARCWQPAVLTPLSPLDRQRLLDEDDCAQRLRLVEQYLAEQEELLRFRLSDD